MLSDCCSVRPLGVVTAGRGLEAAEKFTLQHLEDTLPVLPAIPLTILMNLVSLSKSLLHTGHRHMLPLPRSHQKSLCLHRWRCRSHRGPCRRSVPLRHLYLADPSIWPSPRCSSAASPRCPSLHLLHYLM